MADFVAVLRKTINGLADNTPAMREKVYEKARATVAAKLAAINPPPPVAVADRQKQVLEDAIRDVEAGYSGKDGDPFSELENVFAEPAKTEEPAEAKAPPAAPEAPLAPSAILPGSQADTAPWFGPGEPAEPEPELSGTDERPAVPFDGDEEQADDEPGFEEPERRRSFAPLIAAAVVLALLLGGGYAVWLNRTDFMAMLGIGGSDAVATAPAAGETAPPPAAPPAAAKTGSGEPASQKFTQRLNTDGTEVDEGRAGGVASIGEGTSVAAITQPPAATGDAAATASPPAMGDAAATATTDGAPPVAPAAPAPTVAATDGAATAGEGQVAVGQKAIFYEERTNVAEGSAEDGSVVWSLVQESPGEGQPPEAAIHGEATIPGKNIELRMTIRRNADKTLPASHIIELIFLMPEDFDGGGIENILRFALKDTEEAAGNALLGIPPTKIGDGYFLIALSDAKAELQTNMTLLKREQWIDVPLIYKSGRRALFTMEKGVPGDKVFDEAIKAWEGAAASAG